MNRAAMMVMLISLAKSYLVRGGGSRDGKRIFGVVTALGFKTFFRTIRFPILIVCLPNWVQVEERHTSQIAIVDTFKNEKSF